MGGQRSSPAPTNPNRQPPSTRQPPTAAQHPPTAAQHPPGGATSRHTGPPPPPARRAARAPPPGSGGGGRCWVGLGEAGRARRGQHPRWASTRVERRPAPASPPATAPCPSHPPTLACPSLSTMIWSASMMVERLRAGRNGAGASGGQQRGAAVCAGGPLAAADRHSLRPPPTTGISAGRAAPGAPVRHNEHGAVGARVGQRRLRLSGGRAVVAGG